MEYERALAKGMYCLTVHHVRRHITEKCNSQIVMYTTDSMTDLAWNVTGKVKQSDCHVYH
eukprot:599843-Heterocapsa_arctica.AAC.1